MTTIVSTIGSASVAIRLAVLLTVMLVMQLAVVRSIVNMGPPRPMPPLVEAVYCCLTAVEKSANGARNKSLLDEPPSSGAGGSGEGGIRSKGASNPMCQKSHTAHIHIHTSTVNIRAHW